MKMKLIPQVKKANDDDAPGSPNRYDFDTKGGIVTLYNQGKEVSLDAPTSKAILKEMTGTDGHYKSREECYPIMRRYWSKGKSGQKQGSVKTSALVKKADAAEFEDSTEATEAYQDIDQLLNDPRLMNWALITDKNYGTRIVAPLKVVIANWKLVFEPMMNAE